MNRQQLKQLIERGILYQPAGKTVPTRERYQRFLIRLGEKRPIPQDASFRLAPLTDSVGRRPESAGADDPLPLLSAGSPLASKRLNAAPVQGTAFLPEPFGTPSADGVALAASDAPPADPFTLLPIYSRDSAAEEKRKMAK